MNTHISSVNNQVLEFWKNKRVLITGGSAGLGKGLALYLSSLNARVAITGRNSERFKSLNQENENIITIQADIAKQEDIYKITGQVIGIFGETVDVIINNASTLGGAPLKLLIDTPCENFSETLETNVLGPFRLIKALLPGMLLNDSGLIVNITSDASVATYPTWGIYSASKAALDHLTAIWSKEIPNITFLAIDPGDMFTEMQLMANPDAKEQDLLDPNDVAKDLAFFLSNYNSDNNRTRFSSSEWRKLI